MIERDRLGIIIHSLLKVVGLKILSGMPPIFLRETAHFWEFSPEDI